MKTYLTVLLLLLVGVSGDEPASRGIVQGPLNDAFEMGPQRTLTCRSTAVNGSEQIQWREYGTNPSGALISDGTTLVQGHPNFNRYTLVHNTIDQYDLVIADTQLSDGTYYDCSDANAVLPETVSAGAQLVVIKAKPNCSTTLPSNGVVFEGEYHTGECIATFQASAGVAPIMTWTGPSPFSEAHTTTDTTVWAGISFTVDRSMESKIYKCLTNFTSQGFMQPNSATNIPTYSDTFLSHQILVHWPPKNMYSSPVYEHYEVGQTITCFADAFPMAEIYWHSLRTNEFWNSVSFTIREDMIGNQTMRCHAENFINNDVYYADYFVDVNVPPVTTTTLTPPEADCFDPTGRWEATDPKATMCIWIDHQHNGLLTGLFKNATDTYYADIYGRAQVNSWDQGGFSANWPGNLGVSAHVFECRRCDGVEILTLSQQIRTDEGEYYGGVTNYRPDFVFARVDIEPPCSSEPPP